MLHRAYKKKIASLLSVTILLTQGFPTTLIGHAMEQAQTIPINGEVMISWNTPDEIGLNAPFDPLDGVTALDADGDDVTFLIKIEGEVNTHEPGSYSLEYFIENIEGDVFNVTRNIVVQPPIQINETIEEELLPNETVVDEAPSLPDETVVDEAPSLPDETVVDETPSLPDETVVDEAPSLPNEMSLDKVYFKFSLTKEANPYLQIGFNPLQKEYTVIIDHTSLNELMQSGLIMDLNHEIIHLMILDSIGKEKLSLHLSTNDLLNNHALESLQQLTYEEGDQIAIKIEPEIQNFILVDGVIGGDITEQQEDYRDGIDNFDYLDNVRFIIQSNGLKVFYNQAPIIEGADDIEVLSFDDFNPLEGISVTDDHDTDLTEQLTVTSQELSQIQKEFTYQVADSWGRVSTITRKVTVSDIDTQSSTNDNRNTTSTTTNSRYPYKIEVGGQDVEGHGNLRAFIELDTTEMKFKVTKAIETVLNGNRDKNPVYFKMVLLDSSGKLKWEKQLTSLQTTQDLAAAIHDQSFAYGDKLYLYHLDGALSIVDVNQSSNGSLGNQKNLNNVVFEIEQQGFEYGPASTPVITGKDIQVIQGEIITEDIIKKGIEATDAIQGDITSYVTYSEESVNKIDTSIIGQNKVTYTVTNDFGKTATLTRSIDVVDPVYPNTIDVRGIAVGGTGDKKFTITFNVETMKLNVGNLNNSGNAIHNYFPTKTYFGIKIMSDKNGTLETKFNETFNGDTTPAEVKASLDNVPFEYGDLIEFYHAEPSSRFLITGNIIDYDSEADKVRVLYEVTPFGLKDSKKIPVIKGLKDINILKGTTATRDVYMQGITASDYTGDITNQVTYTENLDPNGKGTYTIKYTVTNKYGSYEGKRIIYVKTAPVISEAPDISKQLEQGSIEDGSIESYLKSLVTVTDEDQATIGDSLQVDKNNFNPNVTGTYSITFNVTDNDGYTDSYTMDIEVIRTINVTVPITIPFQVVTNLIEDPNNPSQDRFIAGVMKVSNNNTTPVEVSVKSFCKVQGSGSLELVNPTTVSNWDHLSVTDSMNKMALGLYHVSGFDNVTNLTKDSPIWLTEQITNQSIGQLPRASSLSNPSEGKLSFVAQYGKHFESGKTRAKFNLVLEFR